MQTLSKILTSKKSILVALLILILIIVTINDVKILLIRNRQLKEYDQKISAAKSEFISKQNKINQVLISSANTKLKIELKLEGINSVLSGKSELIKRNTSEMNEFAEVINAKSRTYSQSSLVNTANNLVEENNNLLTEYESVVKDFFKQKRNLDKSGNRFILKEMEIEYCEEEALYDLKEWKESLKLIISKRDSISILSSGFDNQIKEIDELLINIEKVSTRCAKNFNKLDNACEFKEQDIKSYKEYIKTCQQKTKKQQEIYKKICENKKELDGLALE